MLRDLPSMLSLREIADAHVVSINTVKSHLKSVYRKLGVGSRREAVYLARRSAWCDRRPRRGPRRSFVRWPAAAITRARTSPHRLSDHARLGMSAGHEVRPGSHGSAAPTRTDREGRDRMAYEQAGARAFVTPTRLRVPRVPEGLVQRSRLIETGLGAHPVSLVCAPAGSGKTMLVADWARSAQEGGQPVAWLSIEDGDDRPYELWSAVIDALIEASSGAARRRLDGLKPTAPRRRAAVHLRAERRAPRCASGAMACARRSPAHPECRRHRRPGPVPGRTPARCRHGPGLPIRTGPERASPATRRGAP